MKYCTFCGSNMEDNETVCSFCGRQEEHHESVQIDSTGDFARWQSPAPQPKPSKAPMIIGFSIVFGLLACVGILIAIMAFRGPKGYETALDTFCEAINETDVDKLLKLYPPKINNLLKVSMMFVDEEEIIETWIGELGTDMSVRYTVQSATPMNKEDISRCQELLDGIDFEGLLNDIGTVKQGYDVVVTFYLTQDGETFSNETYLSLIQVDGRWCITELLYAFE